MHDMEQKTNQTLNTFTNEHKLQTGKINKHVKGLMGNVVQEFSEFKKLKKYLTAPSTTVTANALMHFCCCCFNLCSTYLPVYRKT